MTMVISVLGDRFSYHHIAGIARFGPDHQFMFRSSFDELIGDLKNKIADVSIIAVENTLAGDVPGNFERIADCDCVITGEIKLRIRLCLGALNGVRFENIRSVYSHPMGIKESSEFFKNKKGIDFIETMSTATAARIIAENRLSSAAAITSRAALHHFGLAMIEPDVSNSTDNITRFLILKMNSLPAKTTTGRMKASLLLHCESNPVTPAQATAFIQVNLQKKLSETKLYLEGEVKDVSPYSGRRVRLNESCEIRFLGIYAEADVIGEPAFEQK